MSSAGPPPPPPPPRPHRETDADRPSETLSAPPLPTADLRCRPAGPKFLAELELAETNPRNARRPKQPVPRRLRVVTRSHPLDQHQHQHHHHHHPKQPFTLTFRNLSTGAKLCKSRRPHLRRDPRAHSSEQPNPYFHEFSTPPLPPPIIRRPRPVKAGLAARHLQAERMLLLENRSFIYLFI